ncbi:S-layer homology domain-containing protein [Candidatus Peregrinibacteria bacterium]|nr:S-layer homology domain-containing protein [Candidatus Peregrinibacteria bacterium]
MKKLFVFLFALSFILPVNIAFASTTATPTVDTPASPVNSSKTTITGQTSAGAKIITTGGAYDIAPVYANSSGKFSVTVSLAQEATSTYFIQAQKTGSDPSDAVEVTIVESDTEAAAYEAATGTDRTAPLPPDLDESTVNTSAKTYSITGSGEADANVLVTGTNTANGTTNSSGEFSVAVSLKGENKTDTFNVSLKDAAGNVSAATQIKITSSASEESDTDSSPVSFTVTATDFKLTPSVLSAEFGQEIMVTFTNNGQANHNFVISELGVTSETIAPGASTSVTFTPGKSGTFTYICSISGHNEAGMHGTLKVTSATAAQSELSDIAGHWAKNYINELYEQGIVGGYSDGRFGPDDPVTRAQILKMALLAFNHDVTGSNADFGDVSASAWHKDYVGYAQANNIVSGYSDGTFRPDSYVDRAGAIKIILLAAGVDVGTSTTPNFTDVSSADWFAVYTAYAKANGIIGGYGDGSYKGGQSITRAEVAKILAVMIE